LRKILKRVDVRKSELFKNNKLKENLNKFINGKTTNVRVAATVLRVMFAHGTFTPTGTDTVTKSGSEAIHVLSQCILQESNLRFNRWLQQKQ
jgi:hypothetical protein